MMMNPPENDEPAKKVRDPRAGPLAVMLRLLGLRGPREMDVLFAGATVNFGDGHIYRIHKQCLIYMGAK
jgi:hypothetical protein